MRKNCIQKRTFLLLLCFFMVQGSADLHAASERILKFHSDITINTDRTVDVTETIEVLSLGEQIRHGIAHELPMHYRNEKYGTREKVDYTIIETRLDGRFIPHTVEPYMNGIDIKIQRPGVRLKPGKHTFTLTYKTERQLGFYDNYDELAWNVTGSGWLFPIDFASAAITFPPSIPHNKITYEAYTGHFDSKGKNYTAHFTSENKLLFETTQPLGIKGNITIVAMWPKGYILPPSILEKIYYFFSDNLLIVWFLLSLIFLLMYGVWAWRHTQRKRGILDNKPIIPHFYPPKDFGPDDVYFLVHKKYDSKALTARIVDLAVRGFLTIENTKHLFSTSYALHKIPEDQAPTPTDQENLVLSRLFPKKDIVILDKKYNPIIDKVNDALKYHIQKKIGYTYISRSTELLSSGGILAALFFMIAIVLVWYPDQYTEIDILILVILGIWYLSFMIGLSKILHIHTAEGYRIKKEIDGFELFLKTTEQDRMKIVGTPPTRTPELYETYLPYAIALGVEKEWSKQFAPLFASFEKQGNPYQPHWYPGIRNISSFNSSLFSSSFASTIIRSVSVPISSSRSAPGTRSSGGGGGYSGSGGGGGGGRGI